jgi:peptidoglycan DL-endopeptidase CwlO
VASRMFSAGGSTRRAWLTLGCAAVATVAGPPLSGHAEPTASIPAVTRQVEQLHHKAEQATERYNVAQDRRAEVAKRLAAVQSRTEQQQIRLTALQHRVSRYAAATYRNGGLDPRVRLLLADDPQQFLRQASSLEEVARRQATVLRQVDAGRLALVRDRLAVAQELARLEATRRTLAAEKASVERTLLQARRVLDQLEAEDRARLEAARRAAVEKAIRDGRAAARAHRASRASRSAATEAPSRESASRSSSARSRAGGSPKPRTRSAPAASGGAGAAVAFAYAQLGEPYQYGAAGPGSWDCSGLTMMAWRAGGKSLSRSSAAQMGDGARVSRSSLQPGDLVFYYSPVSHVAIYVGGGKIVHSTHPGDVVSLDPVDSMPFAGAVRP